MLVQLENIIIVRLMDRAASHITLECALQTRPNITIIGEEVAAKKRTMKNITDYITDVICKRAEVGYNYGVILIPEGLIDFIPEVQQLIAELNEFSLVMLLMKVECGRRNSGVNLTAFLNFYHKQFRSN